MATATTKPSNGKSAKPVADAKTKSDVKSAPAPKPQAPSSDEKPSGAMEKKVRLQRMVENVKELSSLLEGHDKLSEAIAGVKDILGSPAASLQFTLKDISKDTTFQTYNENLIRPVMTETLAKLEARRDEISDRIVAFSV